MSLSLRHEFLHGEMMSGRQTGNVTAKNYPADARQASSLQVALFSGNYNCVRDGANNALIRLSRFLLDRGVALRIYAPTCPHPAFPPVGDLVSVPSVPLPGRSEYRLALGLGPAGRRNIRRFSPTVFHLSAPDALGWQAQSFACRLGAPVVASLHTRFETYLDYYGLGFARRLAERYLRAFYNRCDLLLAPTPGMAEWLRANGVGARVHIWSRGVDRDLFCPDRRDDTWRRLHGYQDQDVILLFFGRLVLEKGLETFAQAVRALRLREYPVRPVVIGAGPERARFAAALGDAVFTGHLEGEALATAVASADILFNPSVTESFGNVTLEAMASGLAVVSADCSAARNLLSHQKTGLLVPLNDIRLCADALERLIRDPDLRLALGRAARCRSADFTWSGTLATPLDAYHEAVRMKNAWHHG